MNRFTYHMIAMVVFVPAVCAMDDELSELSMNMPSTQAAPASNVPINQTASGPLKWQPRPSDAEGVTTINAARGNWFFKGQILKDARAVYNKILKKVTAIAPLQEKFIADHAGINNILYVFNQEYGFQSGEIDERSNSLLEQIKSYESSSGSLDPEGHAFLAELNSKKEEIEALKKDFDYLQKLDNALSQGLATMSSQLTRANGYEEQAWRQYEKIEELLNDEEAEELLQKMQLAFDNVAAIETYLTEAFRVFFATTIEQIKQQIEVVKNHIVTLKVQGIALGKKMQELQAKEDEERRLADEERVREKVHKERESKRTWLSPIFDTLSWVWVSVRDTVTGWYTGLMNWWFAKPKPIKTIVVEQCPAEEVPTEEAPSIQEMDENMNTEKQNETRAQEPVHQVPTIPEFKPLEQVMPIVDLPHVPEGEESEAEFEMIESEEE